MKPEVVLEYEFVEHIPDDIKERTLYVSVKYATVVHKCCCGCGREVVTPLSPNAWKLTFDGVSVSLLPSIGSWTLPCQSHYWIERSAVRWAPRWSQAQIEAGRAAEAQARARYYGTEPPEGEPPRLTPSPPPSSEVVAGAGATGGAERAPGLWRRLMRWLFGH